MLEDGREWEYQYDAMGQVTSGRKKTAAGADVPGMAFGYAFDGIGNCLRSAPARRNADSSSGIRNGHNSLRAKGLCASATANGRSRYPFRTVTARP